MPTPTRIVTTAYRYKLPPRKRKAVPLDAPSVVRVKAGNDNRPEPEPAIVTIPSRKQTRLLRAERMVEPDDSEATERVRAFFARMMRTGG